jgi:hypothetical protein
MTISGHKTATHTLFGYPNKMADEPYMPEDKRLVAKALQDQPVGTYVLVTITVIPSQQVAGNQS